ncbi:MAG: hypothetical protein UHZ01_08065 [Prevotella sp.]|nr:hypothetical protein [Prevotella sp.]
MSICVTVRTEKSIAAEELFKYLVEKGERIVTTTIGFPTLHLGNHQEAIRGIEVNKDDDGYEVRTLVCSSKEDVLLFRKTIMALIDITGGKAYMDNDDEEPIDNPLERFDDNWIEETIYDGFNGLKIIAYLQGGPVIINGLFCDFCIGPKLLSGFDIPQYGEYDKEDMEELLDYICWKQWQLSNLKDTKTRMMLNDPADPEKQQLSISSISINEGKVSDFDYISVADVFAFIDMDEKRAPVLVPFKELWKILPEDTFRLIDEWQYERTGEVTADMVREMMDKAVLYQPEDLHYKPTMPGQGFDERQNTFILMWNPAISSYKLEVHNESIGNLLTECFNWSISDYAKAKCGDRFYLVRCGKGNTGIVMSGVFDSHPYEAGDWSGRGRTVYYMDMIPNLILNPDKAPMITTEQLLKAIPTFDWTGGRSGRLLSLQEAQALESLWQKYFNENADKADGVTMNAIKLYIQELLVG